MSDDPSPPPIVPDRPAVRPSWGRLGPRVRWTCGVLGHLNHAGDIEAGWAEWQALDESAKARWAAAAEAMLSGRY